jgi:hypothetical protein
MPREFGLRLQTERDTALACRADPDSETVGPIALSV